ncbi:MAG: hypothetical protein GVY26_17390 [Bacteroidetes bacterium]|jgi:hypothetical protein|nr:hypothetical protein [Bacteroidota bacterium]
MKTIYITFFLLFSICFFAQSQSVDSSMWREMGLRLSSVDDFVFIYKKQLEENRFKRFRFAFSNIGFRTFENIDNTFSLSIGGAIGWEKRKQIAEKVQFIHGWEPALRIFLDDNANGTGLLFRTSIGYVLGFQLMVSEHFYAALETIPSLSTDIGVGLRDDEFAVNAGFSSNSIALTLVYRFQPTKP